LLHDSLSTVDYNARLTEFVYLIQQLLAYFKIDSDTMLPLVGFWAIL
jgi:hypothetical protein